MAAGELRYWTGLPCKHGHIAERMTNDGGCTECARPRAVEVYWKDPEKARAKVAAGRAADPEKHRAVGRKSYQNHAEKRRLDGRDDHFENRDQRIATSRTWKEDHPEQNAAITQAWRASHTAHVAEHNAWYKAKHALTISEWKKRYRAENMERHALYERTRRARKAGADGFHTIEDVWRILTSQNHQCAYCPFVLFRFHIDHIMPLVLGGSDGPENIQALCPRCNMRKGPKHPDVFARLMGMLA
jgi:5-methylcytosine-specific restriction endonuclease McrA